MTFCDLFEIVVGHPPLHLSQLNFIAASLENHAANAGLAEHALDSSNLLPPIYTSTRHNGWWVKDFASQRVPLLGFDLVKRRCSSLSEESQEKQLQLQRSAGTAKDGRGIG